MTAARFALVMLMVLLTACAAMRQSHAPHAPVECRLTPHVKSPTQDLFVGWPDYFNMSATTPPEPLTAEAAYRFGSPRYAAVAIGDDATVDPFTLVLDASPGLENVPELCIYFDSNNNEDLTDDPSLFPATPPEANDYGDGRRFDATFQTAQANVVVDGRAVVRHLEFSFGRSIAVPGSDIVDSIRVSMADYMAGTMQVGQQSFPVRLIDGNKNAKFGDARRTGVDHPQADPPIPVCDCLGTRYACQQAHPVHTHGVNANAIRYSEGDSLVLGSLDDAHPDEWRARDVRPVADFLCLGGRCYAWQIAPSGESMTLLPPDVPTGALSFPLPNCRITLTRGEGTLVAGPGKAMVPVGRYGVNSVYFGVTDDEGNRWDCNSSVQALGMTLNVKAGRTLRCRLGPPFTATIRTKQLGRRGYLLTVELIGNGGERYDWSYGVRKNGQNIRPNVLVEDAHGQEVLRRVGFSRGSDYIADGHVWDVPSGLSGRFTVTPLVDLGPLPVRLVPAELSIPCM